MGDHLERWYATQMHVFHLSASLTGVENQGYFL
jgi:hypothetical protein